MKSDRWKFLWILIFSAEISVALDIPYRDGKGGGGSPGEWVSVSPASARLAGMGNAAAGLSQAEVAYVNPAALARIQVGEATVAMGPIFSGGQLNFLSGSYPFTRRSGGGLTVMDLRSGDAERTNEFGESQGNFREQNLALFFSYARKMWDPYVDAGINFKTIRQSFADYSATGYGADIGFMVEPFTKPLTFGLVFQNIVPVSLKLNNESDKFPFIIKEGVSYNFDWLDRNSLVSVETTQGPSGAKWALGLEQDFSDQIPILMRLGANTREFSFGFAFGKKLMTLDYAAIFHELGLLHRFGITVHFSAVGLVAEKEIKAEWKRIEEKEVALGKKEREIAQADAAPSVVAQLEKARDLYRFKKYEACSNVLDKVLPSMTDNEEVKILIAMTHAHIFIEKEDFKSAEIELRKAVELDPEHEEALELYGRVKELLEVYE